MTTRAKIVATIGPASDGPDCIDGLLGAGMSVARVNCAHGDPAYRKVVIERLRERARLAGRPLAVLADLAGPKLRIGDFADGSVELRQGQEFVLDTEGTPGDESRVSLSYADLAGDVEAGADIYLNDGLVHLTVTSVDGTRIVTRVEVGGALSDRKGLAVPSAPLRLPALTEKDRDDLETVLAAQVDYVSLSFVRSVRDLELLREAMSGRSVLPLVVAKIEKAQAIESLEEIVEAADGVMVARGDLGVECPIEDVPELQKRIIEVCRRHGTPVITATQMLESMERSPRPTRAEATDVANAVLDGTDAIMLSGETAVGVHPVRVVEMMARIAARAEAVSIGACRAAETAGASMIVALTKSGATARSLARWRPQQPILAVTEGAEVVHRLGLVWGVEPVLVNDLGPDFDRACRNTLQWLREQQRLPAGARVVITAGLPFGRAGFANTFRLETV